MHGMKSKGFTLVEIIAVIALLAIVVTVVAINMVGVKTNTTEIETKRFKERVTSSGCQYVDKATIDDEKLKLSSNTNCSDNSSLTSRNDCKNNSGGCYVCLKTLLEAGMIDRDTIDPNTDKKISDLNAIEIAKYKVLVKWKTNSDGTKEKECSFIGPDDENPVIVVDIYKLMFNANGGSVSETVRNVKKGNQYGTLPVPTRGDDYNFLGWFTAASGGSKVSATTTMGSSDTTVYAHWESNNHKLKFNANGGSVSESERNIRQGNQYGTLPIPTKTGYFSLGWFTAASGGSQVSATTTMGSSDTTVYAHWQPSIYVVTLYNYSSNSNAINVIYGQTLPNVTPPTRPNYVFDGYYTNLNGVGTKYYDAKGIPLRNSDFTSDTTLYANWKSIKCTYEKWGYKNGYIGTYECDGSNAILSSCRYKNTLTSSSTYKYICSDISPCTETGTTNNSYVRTNCSNNAGSKTKTYPGNLAATESCNCNTHTITINSMLGNFDGSTTYDTKQVQVVDNTVVNFNLYKPKRNGYSVSYWCKVTSWNKTNGRPRPTNCSNNEVSSLTKWTEDATVIPIFESDQYTVSFNSQGGSSCNDVTVAYNSSLGNKMCNSTRSGYSLEGWYTETNGSGTEYTDETNITSNVTLYAKWTQVPSYTLTYDNQGGSGCSSVTRSSGSKWGTLCIPAKANRYFDGWYTSRYGEGTLVDENTDVKGNLTVYAKWIYYRYNYSDTERYDQSTGYTIGSWRGEYECRENSSVGTLRNCYLSSASFSGTYYSLVQCDKYHYYYAYDTGTYEGNDLYMCNDAYSWTFSSSKSYQTASDCSNELPPTEILKGRLSRTISCSGGYAN